jgi:peptide deformylase
VAIFLLGSDDEATRAAVAQRYPGETIPPAVLMINPEILRYGEETYFPTHGEGCLSVAGPIRGKVPRHREIWLRYLTLDGIWQEKACVGLEAHIVQHEYDHLCGTVYLQKIFAACDDDQKATINRLLRAESTRRRNASVHSMPVGDAPPVLVFDRAGEAVVFDPACLAQALVAIPEASLRGMQSVLQSA